MREATMRARALFQKHLCPDPKHSHLVPIGSSMSGLAYRDDCDADFCWVAHPSVRKDFHSSLHRRVYAPFQPNTHSVMLDI